MNKSFMPFYLRWRPLANGGQVGALVLFVLFSWLHQCLYEKSLAHYQVYYNVEVLQRIF